MIEKLFVKIYEEAFQKNWELPAITNYNNGKSLTTGEFARDVAKVHLLLETLDIKQQEKVTLIANDCAEWCIAWMGIVTYGAIAVPILPDFHATDIINIINHSDSKVVFADTIHQKLLTKEAIPHVLATIDLVSLGVIKELSHSKESVDINLSELMQQRYPKGFTRNDIQYPAIHNSEVALINYTSGTSGFSKGVLITHNNLAANMFFSIGEEIMLKKETLLCFLPNAHAYSCTFNFLLPLASGTHIYILGLKPTPKVLISALKEVKPGIILSVPLVLEKMYKSIIHPTISKNPIRTLLHIPILRTIVKRTIRKKLITNFGGNLKEMIIGGAALNDEVGNFLHSIKFPLVIGYGMTECAPLITYTTHRKGYVKGSCGRPMKGFEEVRIANAKNIDGEMVGEIQVRGENVCNGYYKEEQLTNELFTNDGWMHTGDLGTFDKGCNLFIKGRSKAMLLGPDGQNIYPEKIEAQVSLLPYVLENIVVQRNTRIVAVVVPDFTALKRDGITNDDEIEAVMNNNRHIVNEQLPIYERISQFEIRKEEFEKTPKQSIKRYLVK